MQQVRVVEIVGRHKLLHEFLYPAVIKGNVNLDCDFHVEELGVSGEPHVSERSASFLLYQSVATCKQLIRL